MAPIDPMVDAARPWTATLATSEEWAARGGTEEDRQVAEALRKSGASVHLRAWSDAGWSDLVGPGHVVLIRSCWDYHHHRERFGAWLDEVAATGANVWNPPSLIRWNMDKRYLLGLEERGVAIVPTVVRSQVETADLVALGAEMSCEELVIKPTVGASAEGCRRVRPADTGAIALPTETGPWLIQPFVDAIVDEGEWSLVSIDGELRHAVVKRPASGDYRVQEELGGSSTRLPIPEDLRAAATTIVDAAPEPPLYARIDLVRWRGRVRLMELELIEPHLFFEDGDEGLRALVRALERRTLGDPGPTR